MADLRKLLKKLNVVEQPILDRGAEKGSSFELLYNWARTTTQFKKFVAWNAEPSGRVLWLDGDPGAGKTELLQAAVLRLPEDQGDGTSGSAGPKQVSYFLCDSGIPRQDNALSALKSLIYQVIYSQPSLSNHLTDKFATTKREHFDDSNDFYAMAMVLYDLLNDEGFQPTYFVLDGIEELAADKDVDLAGPSTSAYEGGCRDPLDERGLGDLLSLISTTVKVSRKIRWLVSIDSHRCAGRRSIREDAELCLSINPDLAVIREIAGMYTASRVAEIADKAHYRGNLRERMAEKIRQASTGNFLWLNMALDVAKASPTPWNVPEIFDELKARAPNIFSLYNRRKADIGKLRERDRAYCAKILSAAAVAYRPLLASELNSIIDLPQEVDLAILVNQFLPLFLRLYEDEVLGEQRLRFVHLSAKDFILQDLESQPVSKPHLDMAENCLKILLKSFGCRHNNPSVDNSTHGDGIPNDYAMMFWIKHLSELHEHDREAMAALVSHFLKEHEMQWLEILDSRGQLQEALAMMDKINLALSTKASVTFSKVGPYEAWGLVANPCIYRLGDSTPRRPTRFTKPSDGLVSS